MRHLPTLEQGAGDGKGYGMTRTSRLAASILASVLLTASAVAGPLGTDPTGIPGFTGTVAFSASDGQTSLLIDLDFAVFEPGVYPDDGIAGDDPSDGTDYVYAYQGFNTGAIGDAVLTTFSVGLASGSGAANVGDDPLHELTGGLSPDSAQLFADSAKFDYEPPQLPPGEWSTVLLFTSPNPPTFGDASVINGGLADQQSVPVPLPEPTTLVLLTVVAAAARRRRAI